MRSRGRWWHPGAAQAKPPGAFADPAASNGVVGSARYAYREGVADLVGRTRGDTVALREVGGDGVLDAHGLGLVAEVAQQEGDGEDRGGRVGLALPRDVGGRAVDRLEHRRERARRVDVAGGGQADAAGDGGGEVGEDVTEEVVGDDDVEALRLGDEEDRRGVDVQIVGADLRILGGDLVEGVLPEVVA